MTGLVLAMTNIDSPILDSDRFREVLSHWAATVGVIAVRDPDDDRIYGTTITSFTPVHANPPLVLVSLGAGAQVLPFLAEGRRYVINLLAEDQSRIASVYADSFPVGPSPFPESGPPVIDGALAALHCRVNTLVAVEGGNRLVLGWVEQADLAPERRPLLWHRRTTTTLARAPQ
jgi:flavin reductase (DIM6/NTAB) family NADH-FMN oxidoreductase RutF